tara:strand:+ start:183 stop:353 length:171 start_codon:yes stop_codon:yes gene_type:complete
MEKTHVLTWFVDELNDDPSDIAVRLEEIEEDDMDGGFYSGGPISEGCRWVRPTFSE